jgi:hypothetical protein
VGGEGTLNHTLGVMATEKVGVRGSVDSAQCSSFRALEVFGRSLRLGVGVLTAGGDEGIQVVAIDADVSAEFDDGDASFGAEAADEAGGGAEAFGGLVDGE